jgi:transposase
MRQTLLTEFRHVHAAVKSRTYPYHPRPPTPRPWRSYDQAQTNELPEVISLIGRLINETDLKTATGRGCAHPKGLLAKLLLAQQYDGRGNRNSIGLLTLMGERLRIASTRNPPSYKALERAYEDPAVVGLLNEVFFLTQRPVQGLEDSFAVDGTCFPATIKQNWESAKEEFLKKPNGRRVFEKTIIACGTTFKIIAGFAVTSTPHAHDSPYLKPLLTQIRELYEDVKLVVADSGFLSRENCKAITELEAKPRIMPKGNVSMKAKGVKAWRDMLREFTEQTQAWLRDYHTRSISETIPSTMKRTNPTPIRKKLIIRRTVELLARICIYNIRQLTYLKYTHNIQLNFTTTHN